MLCMLALAATSVAGSTRVRRLTGMATAHDYFGLRAELERRGPPRKLRERYYAALVASAFGHTIEAEHEIDELLDETLPMAWRTGLLELSMHAKLRHHDYNGALAAARGMSVLKASRKVMDDAANMAALLEALTDVPAQTATVAGKQTHVMRHADGNGGFCAPLRIDQHERCLAFDTGANFSVLIRSEAEALGLRLRSSNVHVGNGAGGEVLSDIAVVPELQIGAMTLHHVVFLVLPDAAMTFPGARIKGLLGYPVLAALGRVRFNADHSIDIMHATDRASLPNIAFEGQLPLVELRFQGVPQLCALDSGASHTVFYKPFSLRFSAWLDAHGRRHRLRLGNAGGIRTMDAIRVPQMTIELGGRSVHLERVDVITDQTRPTEPYLMCNVGLDALGAGRAYTIDFRTQMLTLD